MRLDFAFYVFLVFYRHGERTLYGYVHRQTIYRRTDGLLHGHDGAYGFPPGRLAHQIRLVDVRYVGLAAVDYLYPGELNFSGVQVGMELPGQCHLLKTNRRVRRVAISGNIL